MAHQAVDVLLRIGHIGTAQLGGEEVVTVADTVGMEVGNSLEDTLRAVSFARVDRLVNEVFMDKAVSLFVISGGITGLRAPLHRAGALPLGPALRRPWGRSL